MRRGHGGIWTDGESGWRSRRFLSFKLAWLWAAYIGIFKRTRAAPTLLITPSVPPSPQSVSIPDRLKPALGHYPERWKSAHNHWITVSVAKRFVLTHVSKGITPSKTTKFLVMFLNRQLPKNPACQAGGEVIDPAQHGLI